MRILITGGAGFVGSNLARRFARLTPGTEVVVLDNLRREGVQLNLEELKALGVEFVHGDVRVRSDLDDLSGNFDLVVEASAEPSALAGLADSPRYVVDTNLTGLVHCLDFARTRAHGIVFLSTSRVYSIAPLRQLPLGETPTRLDLDAGKEGPGWSSRGITEDFPTHLPRSLYGATKLAAELIIQEYAEYFGTRAVINRCGVICGPGQFGKPDQGVFTLWLLHHVFNLPLRYQGFGGTGKQVRDLLHPQDLFDLLLMQVSRLDRYNGRVFNVGGGRAGSLSLAELSAMCRELTGNAPVMGTAKDTSPVDIPWYISDTHSVQAAFGWRPRMGPREILRDVHDWAKANETELRRLYAPRTAVRKAA